MSAICSEPAIDSERKAVQMWCEVLKRVHYLHTSGLPAALPVLFVEWVLKIKNDQKQKLPQA